MQSGVTHIPAGLMTIGAGGHGLANTVNHLYDAHQVNPLLQSLFLVTNTCNHDEYGGVAGFFDDIGRFPREYVPVCGVFLASVCEQRCSARCL